MKKGEGVDITVVSCRKSGVRTDKHVPAGHLKDHIHSDQFSWIIVHGNTKHKHVADIAKTFNIGGLDLEDIQMGGQRPKMVEREDYIFTVLHDVMRTKSLQGHQVSLIIHDKFVISFHEANEELIHKTIQRLENSPAKSSAIVTYIILDMITDNYFVELEAVGSRIEKLESTVLRAENTSMVKDIYKVKRELVLLRQTMWPMREVSSAIMKLEHRLLTTKTKPLFRDAYNETVQIIEASEIYREMTSSLLETHLSVLSNRMNEVMKVLTVIATIFIPLTFITGIYGMNFNFMPELNWKYGYFATLGFMAIVAFFMIRHFRKRKWI